MLRDFASNEMLILKWTPKRTNERIEMNEWNAQKKKGVKNANFKNKLWDALYL